MEKEYNGKLVPTLIYVPEDTVKLIVTAKLLNDDDTFQEARMDLGVKDVVDARIQGYEYDEDNALYSITDKGREYVKQIKGDSMREELDEL